MYDPKAEVGSEDRCVEQLVQEYNKPIPRKILLTLAELMEMGMVNDDNLKELALEYLKHKGG